MRTTVDIDHLYERLTDGYRRSPRVEDLVFEAAGDWPDLPSPEQIAEDRLHKQSEKKGLELEQGRFLARLLATPRPGRHLLHAMLRPKADSLARAEEFQRTGRADLGFARVTRQGRIGQVELHNPRFLNAEDDDATAALETAVDLVLL